ncbi:hypothetical protein [Mycolicibacterium litorale]|nr:hypothetical protein [Mycolicibacterium litorale]
MWVVEVNIAGFRFVHRHPHRRRLEISARGLGWRPAPQRPPHVA